jgi:hypothetical protein
MDSFNPEVLRLVVELLSVLAVDAQEAVKTFWKSKT